LRREFLRRDPAHNCLGDGPLYVSGGDFYDDEEEDQATLNTVQTGNHTPYTGEGTPTVDQSAALPPQHPPTDATVAQASTNDTQVKPEVEEGDQHAAMNTTENGQPDIAEKEEDEKPAWLAEFPNSKGWEDLTLQEQVRLDCRCLLFALLTPLNLSLLDICPMGSHRMAPHQCRQI